MEEARLDIVEKIIGYRFKDKKLLARALTHSSYMAEKVGNYQKLEFLGDSIVDFLIADYLCREYPSYNEGTLTKIRAAVVSKNPLAGVVEKLGLHKYMLWNLAGEDVEPGEKTKSDLFESLTAAIYLDGGMAEAEKFVIGNLATLVKLNEEITLDYKSMLLEYAAKHGKYVDFVTSNTEGPPHDPTYTEDVYVNGEQMGSGKNHSKRLAQQRASYHALIKLNIISVRAGY